MKTVLIPLLIAVLGVSGTAALAKNDKPGKPAKVEKPQNNPAKGNKKPVPSDLENIPRVIDTPGSAVVGAANCPPGLAKKNVPCVPPGQVRKYGVGEILPGGFIRLDDPRRWGLWPGGHYVRLGNYVYQINEQTNEVLNLIGAVADILN